MGFLLSIALGDLVSSRFTLWLLSFLLLWSAPAFARVRLQDVCQVEGQREVKLTGMGLVVGLTGTGDGGNNLPAMNALAAALKNMNNPVDSIIALRDADNVAIVMIEATIPATGAHRGQRIDCHVSSFLGATSLRGGRLLIAPVGLAAVRSDVLIGLCSGGIKIEDPLTPTTGRIAGGVVIERNVPSEFTGQLGESALTLLLKPSHASFTSSSEIARVINREFSYETTREPLALATAPGAVRVRIPPQYASTPVDFIAQLLEIGLEHPNTEAKVVVNARTQTVVVTGEVEISPVVISHRNLSIDIGGGFGAAPRDSFVTVPPIDRSPGEVGFEQPPVQLKQLVEALNQMRVPTSDVIEILRELNRSGKLHAKYIEH